MYLVGIEIIDGPPYERLELSSNACIVNLFGIASQADKIEAALSPLFLVSSTLCQKQVLSAC